ncbi:MAG: sugar isomerase [Pirellulaceae bacterium]|nr:sugar isomerase [Pirellulaceae bacterium]
MKVKPVLIYETPQRRPQTTWRNWGGVQTREDAEKELARIKGELDKMQSAADFPIMFLPLQAAQTVEELTPAKDEIASADATLIYAAGGGTALLHAIVKTAKNPIIFCRHKSGPVYFWYETVSPRYLRRSTDELVRKNIDDGDVVIDSQDELLWRLRALCGLRNTIGAKILAVGGASGWSGAYPQTHSPELARERFKLDIRTISYDELGKLISEARADRGTVADARRRADEYLNLPGTTMETERKFVDNAFLLQRIFRRLMEKADCRAITINRCMGTIMQIAETTACLPLSTLNDAGYQAFCESDFVVIPVGLLLGNISGKPQFMNDPTYPHEGVITLAHCTGPRKMDGKHTEPARILTHFESDYGAATKVEMRKGQVVTNVIADFKAERYVGLRGEIIDAPFLPICRNQIDVRIECDSGELARRMPGFHWITCYGDYLKEFGYALKRTGIEWEKLG